MIASVLETIKIHDAYLTRIKINDRCHYIVSIMFVMETLAAIVFLTISMVLGHCVAFNERRMPYQVIVRHDVVDKEVLDCSGVILGPKHVLTTAKCAEYITAADLSIKYGYKNTDSLYKTVEIETIVKHPEFNARFYANNIAVLITKTPMELQANIAEAIEIDEIKDDLSFFASGWGVTKVSATQHFSLLLSIKLVIHVTIKHFSVACIS